MFKDVLNDVVPNQQMFESKDGGENVLTNYQKLGVNMTVEKMVDSIMDIENSIARNGRIGSTRKTINLNKASGKILSGDITGQKK